MHLDVTSPSGMATVSGGAAYVLAAAPEPAGHCAVSPSSGPYFVPPQIAIVLPAISLDHVWDVQKLFAPSSQ